MGGIVFPRGRRSGLPGAFRLYHRYPPHMELSTMAEQAATKEWLRDQSLSNFSEKWGNRLFIRGESGWRNIGTISASLGGQSRLGGAVSLQTGTSMTLIRNRGAEEVLHLLYHQSASVDSQTYVKILQRCTELKDLVLCRHVHEHILRRVGQPNIYTTNTLMKMYIQCGSLPDARQVFDKLKKKTVVSWNTMVAGYAQHGHAKDAFRLFCQMHQEGWKPNKIIYLTILKAFVSSEALEWGKEVHRLALEAGFASDVRVGTALVNMYANYGGIQDARQVLDRMVNRDIISWTAMIGGYAKWGHSKEALQAFQQMQHEGLEPNRVTYMNILSAFASPSALEWGKDVHARFLEAGFVSDILVETALISMYANCGSIKDARKVFDNMGERDVISWNAMIGGYAANGFGEEAFQVFQLMQRENVEPNRVTYVNILNACGCPAIIHLGKEVHAQAIEAGFMCDVSISNALVNMYAKCGSVSDAFGVFNKMVKCNVISCNAMIGGFAENGYSKEAFKVFNQMSKEGLKPDRITYISILNACASPELLQLGKGVHGDIIHSGYESDIRVGAALIKMYARCGSIKDARQFFNKIEIKDIVLWNAIIGAYVDTGDGEEALEVLNLMQREGVKPDRILYCCILNAFAVTGALEWGKDVHAHIISAGFESDMLVGTALINMYAKCGSIVSAREAFDKIVNPDVMSWTSLIGGLAKHGSGHDALQVFEEMKRLGVKPNEVTFVSVLSACSHAGLVDEGRYYFSSMSKDHGMLPTIEHYGCMVDLLGRSGYLDEAESIIKKMPISANASIWGALLSACRMHSNVMLGERVAEKILNIDPQNTAVYSTLSHIYAVAGKWDSVGKVRKWMAGRAVKKEPGLSWIRVDKKVHSFVADDRTHPCAEEIHAELKRLTKAMKGEGYVPDTRFVMHDVHDEQKEQVLCHHSEKLAIAYGLISTAPGTPIHIFKNLRVCPDCHTATKFISKIMGRDIIARDSSRFHHFNSGVCSCGDYW